MAPVQTKGEIEDFSPNIQLLFDIINRLKSECCKKQLKIDDYLGKKLVNRP